MEPPKEMGKRLVRCQKPPSTSDSTYKVIVSVVTSSVICEVEEFVAIVVTKLLVIVVEITGSELVADGAVVGTEDRGWDDLGYHEFFLLFH